MPLFECSGCGSIENTATSNFWDQLARGRAHLCSACDPRILRWHDRFPRRTAAEHLAANPESRIDYPARPKAVEP